MAAPYARARSKAFRYGNPISSLFFYYYYYYLHPLFRDSHANNAHPASRPSYVARHTCSLHTHIKYCLYTRSNGFSKTSINIEKLCKKKKTRHLSYIVYDQPLRFLRARKRTKEPRHVLNERATCCAKGKKRGGWWQRERE